MNAQIPSEDEGLIFGEGLHLTPQSMYSYARNDTLRLRNQG